MGQRSIGEDQQQFGLLITQNFEIGLRKKISLVV
jgi:hypothetical protein